MSGILSHQKLLQRLRYYGCNGRAQNVAQHKIIVFFWKQQPVHARQSLARMWLGSLDRLGGSNSLAGEKAVQLQEYSKQAKPGSQFEKSEQTVSSVYDVTARFCFVAHCVLPSTHGVRYARWTYDLFSPTSARPHESWLDCDTPPAWLAVAEYVARQDAHFQQSGTNFPAPGCGP